MNKAKPKKSPKTGEQSRTAGSLARCVRQIADELLTVNYGRASWEMGDRLAVKKSDGILERDLGGRNRQSIEEVLTRHLSNTLLTESHEI